MKFTISCLLTLQILHTNFGKDWPVVLEKKMLTHEGDSGRQPIAIGHLSYSGDLKCIMNASACVLVII